MRRGPSGARDRS